jgi:hypothetical protein
MDVIIGLPLVSLDSIYYPSLTSLPQGERESIVIYRDCHISPVDGEFRNNRQG